MRIEPSIQRMATGYRINQAKDDAAGLAINEKMKSQITGYEQGTRNAEQSQDALRTADSALGGINDALVRMRDLSVQASNGILTDSDRSIIQREIESLKTNITDQVNNTQFNTRNLLDGSFQNIATATQPSGSGATLNIQSSALSELGIQNFDVTKNFDISTLDTAISRVSEARSQIGAQSNGLDSTVRSNTISQENMVASSSRIADADIALESMRLSQSNINKQFQYQMQRTQQDQKRNQLDLLL